MFDNYVFNVEKSEESRGKDKPKVRKKKWRDERWRHYKEMGQEE